MKLTILVQDTFLSKFIPILVVSGTIHPPRLQGQTSRTYGVLMDFLLSKVDETYNIDESVFDTIEFSDE